MYLSRANILKSPEIASTPPKMYNFPVGVTVIPMLYRDDGDVPLANDSAIGKAHIIAIQRGIVNFRHKVSLTYCLRKKGFQDRFNKNDLGGRKVIHS